MVFILLALFACGACALSSVAYKACGTDYKLTSYTPSVENGYLTFYYAVEDVACDTLLNNITVNMPTCQNCTTQVNHCYNSYWNAETCCSTPYWQNRDAFFLSQGTTVSGYKFSNLKFSEGGIIRFSITVPKTSTYTTGYIYISGTSWTKCSAPVPVCNCGCAACPPATYRPTPNVCNCTNCSTCVAGSYLTSPCTNTTNTMCTPCTSCVAGTTYQSQACSSSGNRICKNCTTCVPGVTYQAQACNTTANRVCNNCTTCVPGVTYQSANCTATSNRVCNTCTTCVPGVTYQSANCNTTANRVCNSCATCVPGVTYQSANCTATSNRVCSNCTTCVSGVTYESRTCNATANRVCNNCSTCVAGVTYEARSCNSTANRVCNNCTTCVAGVTYEARSCNATANRVCNNCTSCAFGTTYQVLPCNATANRVCNNCTTCFPGVTYQAQACSATSDRVCHNCSTCVPGVSYQSRNCSVTMDRLCNNCTTCLPGVTYEAQTCNATSNRVCNNCTTCIPGLQYEAETCNATNDRVCAQCSNCTVNEQVLHLCNATHDTVCVPCPVCASCGVNSHLINGGLNCTCDEGFVQDFSQVNFTCIPQPCCLDCLACNFNSSELCLNHDASLCNYTCLENPGVCTLNASVSVTGYSVEGPFVTYDNLCCGIAVPDSCSCFTYEVSTTSAPIDTFILGTSCPLALCDPSNNVAPPCVDSVLSSDGITPILTILTAPDPNTGLGGLSLSGLGQNLAVGTGTVNYTIRFQGFYNTSSIPIVYSLTAPPGDNLACFISDIGGPACVVCPTPARPIRFYFAEALEILDSENVAEDQLTWLALGAMIPIGILLISFALFAIRRRSLETSAKA